MGPGPMVEWGNSQKKVRYDGDKLAGLGWGGGKIRPTIRSQSLEMLEGDIVMHREK